MWSELDKKMQEDWRYFANTLSKSSTVVTDATANTREMGRDLVEVFEIARDAAWPKTEAAIAGREDRYHLLLQIARRGARRISPADLIAAQEDPFLNRIIKWLLYFSSFEEDDGTPVECYDAFCAEMTENTPDIIKGLDNEFRRLLYMLLIE